MFFLPFHWLWSEQSCANPSLRQPAAPGERGSAPFTDLCRGLLNLLFARFVPGIKSSKLTSGGLILSLFEEVRPLRDISRMQPTRLGEPASASGAQGFHAGWAGWRQRGSADTGPGYSMLAGQLTLSEPPFLPFKNEEYSQEDCFEE